MARQRIRPTAALAAMALAGVVVAGAALPASAGDDAPSVRTDEAQWELDPATGAFYGWARSPESPDYADSLSWVSFVMQGFVPDIAGGELCMTDNGVDPATRVCLGDDDFPGFGQPAMSTVDGATVYTWAPVSDRGLSVGLTLRLKNGSAQYEWALGGEDVDDFDFEFLMTHVMNETQLAASGDSWRAVIDPTFPRPVVGHYWQGGVPESWEFVEDSLGGSLYTFTVDEPTTVTYGIFMATSDPCGVESAERRAITAAEAGVAGFGQAFLAESDTGCIAADDVTVDPGQAIGDLELVLAEELEDYASVLWNEYGIPADDLVTIAEGLLTDDPDVPFRWRGEVTGLPQGVTAGLAVDDQGRVVIRFTGTTTQSGTFAPVVRLWPEHLAGDVLLRVGLPVMTSFDLTVTGPGSGSGGGSGSGSGTGSTTLPVTGADGGPLALLATALLAAGTLALSARQLAGR